MAPIETENYVCENCGRRFSTPRGDFDGWGLTVVIEDDTAPGGTRTLQDFPAELGRDCPFCGGVAMGENVYSLTDGQTTVSGFANDAEDAHRMLPALRDLQALADGAPLEAVLAVLHRGGPQLAPVAAYVRENCQFLTSTALGLGGFVVALLAFLLQLNDDPPEGITPEQLQELIDEVREDPPAQP